MNVLTLQSRLSQAGYDPGPLDGLFGPKTLMALCWRLAGRGTVTPETASLMWRAMRQQEITTPLRIINFLANVAHESRFRIVEEDLNYSAKRLTEVWPHRFPTIAAAAPYAGNPQALANSVYGGRMGNNKAGDGWKYRGRGWPQLTGCEAYKAVGEITGLPLEEDPDLVLTPAGNAAAAAGFWKWKNLAAWADRDNPQQVRRIWNGGLNGWPEVREAVAMLKTIWGLA